MKDALSGHVIFTKNLLNILVVLRLKSKRSIVHPLCKSNFSFDERFRESRYKFSCKWGFTNF